MASAVVMFVGDKVKDAAIDFVIDKALGVEISGFSVRSIPEKLTMAVIAGQGIAPEPSFEMIVDARFKALDDTVAALEKRVDRLKSDLAEFKFDVDVLFGEKEEERHFGSLDALNEAADGFYARMRETLHGSTELDTLKSRAAEFAKDILDSGGGMEARLRSSETIVLGKVLQGLVDEQLTGLMDVWQSQAVRKADSDAAAAQPDLVGVYKLFQAKFLHVLLIQAKVGRLIIEAREAQKKTDTKLRGGAEFYAEVFYPMLLRETAGFRAVIETVALNLLPLPVSGTDVLHIPSQVGGMLGLVDLFSAQVLSGLTTDVPAPLSTPGASLHGLPALAGVWGRLFVPGTRWLRRKAGTDEEASIRFNAGGQDKECHGTLHVRSVQFISYTDKKGVKRHPGYRVLTGDDFRDLQSMLVVEFLPTEVLPPGLPSVFSARLMDSKGSFLADVEIAVLEATIEGRAVQFGTFTTAFTGGAEIRAI